jgi:hypothetical protein
MPKVRNYEHYDFVDDIRRNANVIDNYTKITKHILKHSIKITTGSDYSLYRYIMEDDDDVIAHRYFLMKGKVLSKDKFTSRGYIRKDHFIGYLDVQRQLIKTKNRSTCEISEILFVYTSNLFRGLGYGKILYDLVINEEPILCCGDCLHTEKGMVTSSLGIWLKHIIPKYPTFTYDFRTRMIGTETKDPSVLKSTKIRFLTTTKLNLLCSLVQQA